MTHSSRVTLFACVLGLLALEACSAIVQPDTTRLGGDDAQIVGIDASVSRDDAGPRPDTGPRADAALDTGLVPPEDAGPVCPPSCDDGVPCTDDACVDGICVHATNDALCAPGQHCTPLAGCASDLCTRDAECDDANACNGLERCVPGTPGADAHGCVAGTTLDCNDGASCTDDRCEPATGCVHERHDERCNDGVACTADRCTGTSGPTGCEFVPESTRCADPCRVGSRCTMTGCVDEGPLDADRDGYPAMQVGSTACTGGTDCDDTNPAVHPGAPEICGNGRDDDCDPRTPDACAGTPGDTCANPIEIPLTSTSGGSSTGSVTVSFGALANDYATRCGGSSGRDAIYTFLVSSTSDVTIETTGAVDTILAAAFSCDVGAFRESCNDDRDFGLDRTSRIWLHPVPVASGAPVRVYVLVDRYDGDATGTATLQVTTRPVAPNVCPGSGGAPRPLDISGGGTVLGLITGGLSAQQGSCRFGVDTWPEAIVRIEETDRQLERLTLTGVDFDPYLYVRQGGCAPSASEVGCALAMERTATLTDTGMTATGRSDVFYVFLDGPPITGGAYRLEFNP